jgi:hypothetical protein
MLFVSGGVTPLVNRLSFFLFKLDADSVGSYRWFTLLLLQLLMVFMVLGIT